MPRRLFEYGSVGITYEDSGGILRILDGVPSDENPTPDFSAVLNIRRFPNGICTIVGFKGAASMRQMKGLVSVLLEMGYRVAYIERAEGKSIPGAEKVVGGDFDGLFRLDLVSTRLKPKVLPKPDVN